MERKLTRFLTLLVSLLVLVSLCTTTVFAAEIKTSDDPVCYLHGDVNGDGRVGTQDAIYALYYAMWHDVDETLYPVINQEFDFTGDGKVSTKDALYLLWASVGDENYVLKGDIHEYYKPNWIWTESEEGLTAILTFRCGCGEPIKLTAAQEDITAVTTAATCVAPGKVEYTAKVTYEGVEYTTEKPYVVEIPATADGHDMKGKQGCETESVCSLCGYTLPALGHSWVLSEDETKTYAATCEEMGQQWYDCANEGCEDSHKVDIDKIPHTYAFSESIEPEQKPGTTCTYFVTNTYKCSCGKETTSTSEYDKHSYKAVVTQEATCAAAGEKAYVCEHCGHKNGQTEVIPVNAEAHSWNEGVLDEETGITTYTCSVCGGTKTAVTVAKDAAVSKEQLSNELQLENANVSLDEKTVAELNDEKEIKISITEADLDETGLSDDQKKQVGDNTVYNFSMTYTDGTAITSFAGKVKVSLPYTLGEGEDIDSIDIWYIDDEGNPARMTGTYANGYVTFETNHFSYYTVTRLTPAERCARYGHIWIAAEKAATCTEEGYTKNVCQRCGSEADVVAIPALEHKYTDASDAAAATCTEAGLKHQICERCNHEIEEELPALGHELVDDPDNSHAADCYNSGKEAKKCDRDGCNYTSVKELPQLKHDFGENPKETVYPDCTTGGYDHQKCILCEQDIISNETAPLGHDYGVESWNWNEDKTAVSAKLVCKINPAHTADVKATISVKTEAPSCTSKGYVTYTALISYNKIPFTKSVTVETDALGHQTSGEWQTTESGHYRDCSVCGQKADQADHSWNTVVTKEPTCAATGTAESTCVICGYTTTETVPATGKHDLVGGECTVCGFEEDSCEHIKMNNVPLDLSGYDICEGFEPYAVSCECGENQSLGFANSNCSWGEGIPGTKKLADGREIEIVRQTCTECGLTIEYSDVFWTEDEEICRSYYSEYFGLSINGETIGEAVYVDRSGMMYQDHPATVVKETIDMSTLGMCAGKLKVYTCSCGVALQVERVDGECEFSSGRCTVCGASEHYEHIGYEDLGCVSFDKVTYTLSKDGQAVYTCDCKYAYASHNNQVAKYVMDGENCEDGITVYYVCADCGLKETAYFMHHATVIEEVTDLTGYGSCATASHQFVCPCGAEKYGYESYNGQFVAVGELAHNFELVSEDSETGTSVLLCTKCNYTLTREYAETEKDENCRYVCSTTYTYTDGKGHTYSYVTEYQNLSHNYQQEIVLKGTTCNDGIEVRQTCADCGYSYVQQEYRGHMAFETQRYDLTEYGLCGGEAILYECPCGTYAMLNHFGQCGWEWLDGTENSSVRCCRSCGVTMEEKWEALYKITDCLQRTKVTTTFSKDEEVLLEVSYTTDEGTHRSVYSFELLNPSQGCNGGYRISETCLTCGMEADWGDNNIWYHHENFPVAREIVSVNQLCGDLELVTYSCPCGLDSWVNYQWSNGACNFRWMDNNKAVCTECGAVRTESRTSKKVEGEACKQVTTYGINIVRNGKTICDFSYDTVVSNHKEVATFNLLGTTCDDGYTVSYSCAECGEFLREWTTPQYGCDLYTVEVITVASHEDICNDVVVEIGSCACGQRKTVWENNEYGCDFEYISWDGINQCNKYQCRNCGLIWYNKNNQEHIKGTCTAQRTIDSVYEWDGEVIGTYQNTFVTEDHQSVATFELRGETCDDGYMVYETCVGCGRTESWESWGHNWYQTGYYDLSDYGMCGGEIWTNGCACGQYGGDYGWNWDCEFEHKNYDDATGTSTYYCSECQTYRYDTEIGQRDPTNCTYTGTRTFSFVRDDVTLLTLTREQNYESHAMVADNVTMVNPEGTCEDGVIVNERCEDCDYTQTRTYAYHEDIATLRIDLSDGCGGELRAGGCACGEYQFFHQGYACQNMEHTDMGERDENGIYHYHYQNVCPDCGLVVEREYYYVDSDDACETTRYDTYTITFGGETYVHDNTETYESHDNVKFIGGTLDEDSISCEDGVWIQWQCPTCGTIGEDHYGYHAMIAGESIDLGEYGSYCGATLDLYSCVCGAYQKYDIGEDSECDVGRDGTNHWIDNVIHETQDTSAGYIGTYSYAYLLKCAVSDPVACGMTIRMAEYWLNEGCMAVEYQTWQLGYDEQTGEFEREITIATGEKHAYHPYVRTEVKETLDDGSTKNGYRLDCSDCGSYAYQHDYWDQNGLYTKFECRYVNTMYETNGENRERYDVTEYGYVANNHNYETYRKDGYIRADGSEVWQCYEYTNYDFSNNDCKRTRVYTDSDGYTETTKESAHIVECQYYNDPEPTCSQSGIRHHVHDCVVCGKVDELHDTWELDPTCHYWYWDGDKQVYVCSTCELESAVGATGSICLEDLTEETDSVYTIGYWNRHNIEVTPTVSVILDDVTEDKEWVLTGIDFDYLTVKEDGVRALTFSKADAQAAAEAKIAELSYTGSYAIRISFVPVNGENTLDYAITFDSQNTAQ